MAAATLIEVRRALAGHLKISETALTPYHLEFAERGRTRAISEVKGALLARGFDLTNDIELFDRLQEFTLDLGCYFALVSGGLYASIPAEILKALDRREELKSVFVFVNGEWRQPPSGQPGTAVTAGQLAEDETGVFNWSPAEDPTYYGIRW